MDAVLNLAALVLGLSALFGYLNHRFLRLPHTIGLVVIALFVSLVLVATDRVAPGLGLSRAVAKALIAIDLSDTLINGILSFLLFAGALHVNLEDLLERRWSIGLMATVGVVLSTVIVGTGVWYVFAWFGAPVPYLACLVLGAIISPTDPVAVMGLLKTVRVPPSLEAKIAGESLFNDGVGVVAVSLLAALAFSDAGAQVSAGGAALLFLREAVGGALFGLAVGYGVYRAMRTIDEYNVEVLMTLALATGVYALADALHLSGPIAVVVAGLLIGNHGRRYAMSERTRRHVLDFWSLTDEILNSVLFLVIGFEVLAVSGRISYVGAAAAAVPLALLARLAAVSLPLGALRPWRTFTRGAVWVLTWGGLRGGISVALALALPASPVKEALVTVVYGVVIFSVVVQGLTMKAVIRRVVPAESREAPTG